MGAMSGQSTKTATLRFETEDDAINFARQQVEHSQDWLASNNLCCAKRYEDGRLDIAVHLTARKYARKFQLVLSAIPNIPMKDPGSNFVPESAGQQGQFGLKSHLMLVWSDKTGKRPQKVIPSTVRLEVLDEALQFNGDMFPRSLLLKDLLEVRRILGKREIAVHLAAANLHCGSVDCLIKGVSEIVKGVRCDGTEIVGDIPIDQSDLQHLVSCLRIALFDHDLTASLEEGVTSIFELDNVFFSPRD